MGVKSACATEMGNDCLHRASFLPQIYGKHTATVGAVGFPTVIIDLKPLYQNPTRGPDRSSFLVQISINCQLVLSLGDVPSHTPGVIPNGTVIAGVLTSTNILGRILLKEGRCSIRNSLEPWKYAFQCTNSRRSIDLGKLMPR